MNGHKSKLKQEVGLLGSFSLGFADVGAGIFLALGLIAAHAIGATPLAILVAAFVYLLTGITYAELASAIPIAGGASVYGERAFGKFFGFIGGWGLILDYTICIALFAVASAGYLSYFIPEIRNSFTLVTVSIIAILTAINLFGIKESSRVNSILTVGTIALIIILIGLGITQFHYDKLSSVMKPIEQTPGIHSFLYSVTIAMVAFIGIESISQGAEETVDPENTLPKAHIAAVVMVIVSAMLMSTIALGIVDPSVLSQNVDNSVIAFAMALPFANILAPIVAFAGFAICLVSANTGVIGVSRVTYSMSNHEIVTSKFKWIHPKFCTPWVTIILFSAVAIFLAMYGDIFFLGELYAFGALTAYLIANLAVIKLRFDEPTRKRPFKIPINFRLNKIEIPIPAILGSIGCFVMLCLVALLHEEGRNFAALWFIVGIAYYLGYAEYRKRKQPKQNKN
ncbi:MAG: APC family permease [Candidatus Bilamarchaeum sp.]|jgi:APA family basic amino acid/polyamine antiporter